MEYREVPTRLTCTMRHSSQVLDVLLDVARLSDEARRQLSYCSPSRGGNGHAVVTFQVALELVRAAFVDWREAHRAEQDPDWPARNVRIDLDGPRGRLAAAMATELEIAGGCTPFTSKDARPAPAAERGIADRWPVSAEWGAT